MDFRDLVCKRVWKITLFGLKSGQDLKNRAAHPPPRIPRSTPPHPPPPGPHVRESRFWNPGNFCLCNPESGKVLLIESGTLGFWNKAQGIRNPSSTDKESTSCTWNLESKTVLDSLTQGDLKGTITFVNI